MGTIFGVEVAPVTVAMDPRDIEGEERFMCEALLHPGSGRDVGVQERSAGSGSGGVQGMYCQGRRVAVVVCGAPVEGL